MNLRKLFLYAILATAKVAFAATTLVYPPTSGVYQYQTVTVNGNTYNPAAGSQYAQNADVSTLTADGWTTTNATSGATSGSGSIVLQVDPTIVSPTITSPIFTGASAGGSSAINLTDTQQIPNGDCLSNTSGIQAPAAANPCVYITSVTQGGLMYAPSGTTLATSGPFTAGTPICGTGSSGSAPASCSGPSKYVVFQWHVPVAIPSSGTIGNNGALSGITAFPTTFSNGIYLCFPANAISSGTAAGCYWTVMSTTTAGTIYNNALGSNTPTNVASPTAFSTTGPGAYTQVTTSLTLGTATLPANSLGADGEVTLNAASVNDGSGQPSFNMTLGGSTIASVASSTQYWQPLWRTFRNLGNTSFNVVESVSASLPSDVALNDSTPAFLSLNTTTALTFTLAGHIATASDYLISLGVSAEVSYAP